jgi:hypothetical protein
MDPSRITNACAQVYCRYKYKAQVEHCRANLLLDAGDGRGCIVCENIAEEAFYQDAFLSNQFDFE